MMHWVEDGCLRVGDGCSKRNAAQVPPTLCSANRIKTPTHRRINSYYRMHSHIRYPLILGGWSQSGARWCVHSMVLSPLAQPFANCTSTCYFLCPWLLCTPSHYSGGCRATEGIVVVGTRRWIWYPSPAALYNSPAFFLRLRLPIIRWWMSLNPIICNMLRLCV